MKMNGILTFRTTLLCSTPIGRSAATEPDGQPLQPGFILMES